MKKLIAIFLLLVSITVPASFGSQQVIDTSKTHGDTLQAGGTKINNNFTECYSNILSISTQLSALSTYTTAGFNSVNASIQSNVDALNASIATVQSNLTALGLIVGTNSVNISSNTAAILTNTASILANYSLITNNAYIAAQNNIALSNSIVALNASLSASISNLNVTLSSNLTAVATGLNSSIAINSNSIVLINASIASITNSITLLTSNLDYINSYVTNMMANSVTNPATESFQVLLAVVSTNNAVYPNVNPPSTDPVFPGPATPGSEGATNDFWFVVAQGVPTNAVLEVPSGTPAFYVDASGTAVPLPDGARVCVSHVPSDSYSDYINYLGTNGTVAIPFSGFPPGATNWVGFYTNAFPLTLTSINTYVYQTNGVSSTVQFNKGIYTGH